jgi:hypothetical protein
VTYRDSESFCQRNKHQSQKGVGPFLQVAEYNMSQSPRTTDVEGQQVSNSAVLQAETNQPSPDEHEQQDMSRGPDDPGDHGMGVYDFEVKEQDRWLPIANGMSSSVLPSLRWSDRVRPTREAAEFVPPLHHHLLIDQCHQWPCPFTSPIYSPIARFDISTVESELLLPAQICSFDF